MGLPVPGEGSPQARVVFVGEAPGVEESRTGRPFVGRAGRFFNQLLASIGLDRGQVFVTSPVHYYPGRRRITRPEIEHGRVHLLRQLEILRPGVIVLMGQVAIRALLAPGGFPLSQCHGEPVMKGELTYFPTFHPAAGMRFPRLGEAMKADFQRLRGLLE